MNVDPLPAAETSVRVRVDLAYDGTDFKGWAVQPGLRTVQGEVERGLAQILRTPIRVTVAGRTDAGVHASAQVLHADVPTGRYARMPGRSDRSPERALLERLAAVLPADIAVRSVSEVGADFDARFSALNRTYRYRINDRLECRDPLRRDVAQHKWLLDAPAMHDAATALLGEHDFLSFCKPREGATTIRTLQGIRWQRCEEGADAGLVVATVTADAFCHHMVRSIVGASVAVGEGKADAAWMAALVASPRRDASGSAPMFAPGGLTLESIAYPAADAWAERARGTRARRPAPHH